jgi:hypothetical protein
MKANGAQGRRFPSVITSGYLPNNGLVRHEAAVRRS